MRWARCIKELHPYETLLTGTLMRAPFSQYVMEWSTLCRELNRSNMWDVTIVDDDYEDRPYAEAWMQRYGASWPFISRRNPHPALQRLYNLYARFC